MMSSRICNKSDNRDMGIVAKVGQVNKPCKISRPVKLNRHINTTNAHNVTSKSIGRRNRVFGVKI